MQWSSFWKRLFIGVLLAFALCMSLLAYRLGMALKATQAALGDCERLENLQQVVESDYYDKVDMETLMDGALKGYVGALEDPYSGYLTPGEYQQWQSNEAGVSVGIGVTVTLTEDGSGLQVVSVEDSSPAKIAGLQVDDVITGVDGKTVVDLGYQEAVNHVRGEAGTSVELTVQRGETEWKKTVQRQEIEVISAYGVMLENQIGYIRIASFKENTVEQFQTALQNLLKNGAKALVFDVREDGGGLVAALEKVIDPLLPEGDIATATYNNGETKLLVHSDANELQLPMMVLVNGNTASAAELFTASLKDFEKAEVIGEQTFGKGIMQNTVEMKDGGAVTLTVATYQTTRGECYHGVGITPDVVIKEDYETIDFNHPDPDHDAQLKQAMELLDAKIK
ncbi:MAG: S41 family peptidase [Oscillospiraceae bacterium]|nr:S41 family peptidase [Oscillospiraceae bacterium]